jgi:Dolichyl-phosphate-mannose-protein mannosyltransferase
VQKVVRLTSLFAVLLLAGYLRITGLTWGLKSGYGHYRNFHPDEFISLRGVLQIDLPAGHIKAPGAYFEGTFNYYLWALPKAVLEFLKKTGAPFNASTNSEDHASLLFLCRWMSVLFDLCTVIIVFLAITETSRAFYPALLGALCYAVLPMQVIYAHFMRTQILSNLLCALIIWLSLKLGKHRRWWMILTAGFISGLGAATRYPVGIIVVIPSLYLLFDGSDNLLHWRTRIWESTKRLIAGPIWLIGAGFVIGLFVGHPMLFLDSRSVINAITGGTLKYASLQEFNAGNLLNLFAVWRYVSYLIPFAMYPLLWLVPFCAILYLGFRRSLYSQSAPIVIFSFLYLYFMAKGYLGPYYARETMLLFPGFCVLAGIACDDLWLRLGTQRIVGILLACAFLLLAVPSLGFDVAYVRAMQKTDMRSALRQDLQRTIRSSPATITVLNTAVYFYTVMPAVEPLKSKTVTIQLQEASQPADFLLIGFGRPIDSAQLAGTIRRVERDGNFRHYKSYSVRPELFGREFRLFDFPQDMTYPFPTILLFHTKTEARPASS